MPITIERRPNYTGPLIRVPLGNGLFIQMTEQEAIDKGYIQPAKEAKAPARHKKRTVREG